MGSKGGTKQRNKKNVTEKKRNASQTYLREGRAPDQNQYVFFEQRLT